jgi:orotate phosphoribosyltransferase
MTQATLAKKLYDACYLTGTFKLRSGTTSHEYFDKYRFETQPHLLKEVAEALLKKINLSSFDAFAGLEMGGIPVATALSLASGKPVVFVRKAAKDYGTCRFAEGMEIKGLKLCIVEDVVTTGGQVLQSTSDLRSEGAIIEQVVCVLQRGEDLSAFTKASLSLTPLFKFSELKNT